MITTGQKIAIQRTSRSRLAETDLSTISFGRTFSDHMVIIDHVGGEWQRPQIVPYGDMPMSPASLVLHYSQTIFEGLKAYRSAKGGVHIFRPQANLVRMNRSAERMCMPAIPEEVFMDVLTELVRMDKEWIPQDEDGSLYIRPLLYASDAFIGVRTSDTYRFLVFTCPVRGYYTEAVRVKIETQFSRAFPGGTGEAKCGGNYAASLYPAKLAHDQGFHQVIWTDGVEHKYIEESGTMNVFFRIGNTLITPATDGTILHGVTRDSILQLARRDGLPVEARPITVEEVVRALRSGTMMEAFGAGTAATIAHIKSIAFEGQEYMLPPLEQRTVANQVGKALDDIRRGRAADTFDWLVPVG
jgi:branched-chain amino acid aminotransferase